MVVTKYPNENVVSSRCNKPAKYLISIGGEISAYHACVEHTNEMRSRIEATITPLNPKLIVLT